MLSLNPFVNPTELRQTILSMRTLPFDKIKVTGKSLACIFLTRFCAVGCPFCFYKSKPAWRKRHIEDQFSDEGLQNFLQFTQEANLGYILVSGGGEPMNQRQHILQMVAGAKADRIVLVTSGSWAKNPLAAEKYVADIAQAMARRSQPLTVVVRLSISEGHVAKIGYHPALNLFKIFREKYKGDQYLKLQVKTFYDDPTLEKILEQCPQATLESQHIDLESDNSVLIKKIPKQKRLMFDNGYNFIVGYSKIFNSGLRPDLRDLSQFDEGIAIFNKDLRDSEDYNPSLVFGLQGEIGVDWSINYNGDICTWQNQVRDNYMNLYEDDFQTIYEASVNDPITYSFLEKGNLYRESIVAEVNERAVLRMRAIGLRDTSGTIIFEEEKTRLYFAIRVLQDYIEEQKITQEDIASWPKELRRVVALNRQALMAAYHQSHFSIISQQKRRPFVEQEWLDLFRLIRLEHYDLPPGQLQEALNFYNSQASWKIMNLYDNLGEEGDIERRLTERLMHIKPLKRFESVDTKKYQEEALCS